MNKKKLWNDVEEIIFVYFSAKKVFDAKFDVYSVCSALLIALRPSRGKMVVQKLSIL